MSTAVTTASATAPATRASAAAPATKTSAAAPATRASGTGPATTASGTAPATTGTSGGSGSPPALETPPPAEVQPEKKPSIVKGKGKGKVKDKNAPPKREYMYWEDAFDIEWRAEIEFKGWKLWNTKFGPGTEWWCRYQ